MTRRVVTNVAASVRQRLLNIAKHSSRRFNEVMQHYAAERWLYRLSRSEYAGRFVLKGALMLRAWDIPVTRPTRDIDMLVRSANDLDAVRRMIMAICVTPVEDDGIVFDSESVVTVGITEDADYEGIRATFSARLGTARVAMQIDMGFGDIVTPSPIKITYPTMLNMAAPTLRAYNRETAIAEKFEAMVKIGELNSRMKDFFDIWTLAKNCEFNGMAIANAFCRTFQRRGTTVNTAEPCFAKTYALSAAKAQQWKAFIKRAEIENAPSAFADVWSFTMLFLRPVAIAIENNSPFNMHWPSGGPWQSVT